MPSTLTAAPGWFFPLGVFILCVFFVTLLVRRAVENFLPSFAARAQWKKVWLPSLPVFIGAVGAGVMFKYPFLSTLPTWGTRVVYGMVGGGLSSFAYKVVTAVIEARLGIRLPTTDRPAPAPSPAVVIPSSTPPRVEELPEFEKPTDPGV